jgi:hypothetical protein
MQPEDPASMSKLHQNSRRDFIRKAAYIAPAVATLTVMPAHQAIGSVKGNNGVGNGLDPQPPGNPPFNDPPGSGPGAPGNRP